jgi:Mg/Co/Ni transporter MgtE
MGMLVGVISRMELLDWAKAKIKEDISQVHLHTLVAARLRSAKAKDVAQSFSARHCVKLQDDISKALEIMTEHNLIDVQVVDDQGRILGDITLPLILLKLLHF